MNISMENINGLIATDMQSDNIIKGGNNMLKKLEIRKFTKLANNTDSVLFTSGNKVEYIYNKKTHKRYYPKYELIIER